jgi:hypothetical protein
MGELIEGNFGDRAEEDSRSLGTAIVTPFLAKQAG